MGKSHRSSVVRRRTLYPLATMGVDPLNGHPVGLLLALTHTGGTTNPPPVSETSVIISGDSIIYSGESVLIF